MRPVPARVHAGVLGAVLALTAACVADPTLTITPAASGPLTTLAALTVAVEDTGAHYRRADWGNWTTTHGCDTREQVLAAQGTGETVDSACRPTCPATVPACWTSPYDNLPTRDPADLDIDHLVALAQAERSGARHWTPAQRVRYGNDPLNLVATTAAVNQAKGDRDPAKWQPTWWRCEYAARWVAVKGKYRLTVDQAERDALAGMLGGCPGGTP